MKHLTKRLFPILLTAHGSVYGQGEFLATVDPVTGEHHVTHGLPGVAWIHVLPSFTVFDEMYGRYIFSGMDQELNKKLYSVDVTSGTIVHQPSFPNLSNQNDNIIELEFDNATGMLYALHWNASMQTEHLVRISPLTGDHEIVASIPEVKWISVAPHCTSYDEGNGVFIFRGANASMTWRLYSVDVNTGEVLSAPLFPILNDPQDNIGELQFDNANGTLYGLHWDASEQKEKLVSIDPTSGLHTVLSEIPEIRYLTSSPRYTTFDKTNGTFYFRGADLNMTWRLYAVDVNTGGTQTTPPFPILEDPADNLIELKCDNTTGILYALHWDAHSTIGIQEDLIPRQVLIHPNPFRELTTISFNGPIAHLDLELYNSTGTLVHSRSFRQVDRIDLHKGHLPPGLYYVRLSSEAGNVVRTVIMQ